MKKVWLVVVAIVVVAAGAMGAMKFFGGPSGGVAGVKSAHYQFMKAAQSNTKQIWYQINLDTDNAPSKSNLVDAVWVSQNGKIKVFSMGGKNVYFPDDSLTLGQISKMSEQAILKKYNHREDQVTEKYFDAYKAKTLKDERDDTEDASVKSISFDKINQQNKIAEKKGLKATLVTDGTGNKIVGETLKVPSVSFYFNAVPDLEDVLALSSGSATFDFTTTINNFPIYDKYFSGLYSYSDSGNTGLVVRHDKEIKDYVQWDEEGTKNVKVK